ncbi:MAG: hypothetical protein HFG26_04010 [Provencibacterium sp.]|jgi:hypothetical protein|nr:hypothetical protein [Provencibacterium sp.]
MQLLRITSVPIQYQIQVERARLEMSKEGETRGRMEQRDAQLQLRARNIQMRMDSTDMRASLGLKSVGRKISEAAQQRKQAALNLTAQYASEGEKMTQKGVDVTQIVADRLFGQSQQSSSTLVFLPTVGPAITWQPNDLQVQYNPGELNFDWEIMRNAMDYVPGKFQMNILQYPKVQIEYLGEPSYVPPSSNPNYQGET